MGRPTLKNMHINRVLNLHKQGKTCPEIGRLLCISDCTVRHWLKQEKLKPNIHPEYANRSANKRKLKPKVGKYANLK